MTLYVARHCERSIIHLKQQEMTGEIGETTSPCPLRRGIRKVNGQVLSPSGGGAGGGDPEIFIISVFANYVIDRNGITKQFG